MRSARDYDFRSLDLWVALASPVPGRLDRHCVTFRTTRGDTAARSFRGVQQVQQYVDELRLVAVQSRVRVGAIENVLLRMRDKGQHAEFNDVLTCEVGGLEKMTVMNGFVAGMIPADLLV